MLSFPLSQMTEISEIKFFSCFLHHHIRYRTMAVSLTALDTI